MLNSITIMGRLTRDPEKRYTKSEIPVTSFSIACERDRKDSNGDRLTDFIDVTAWRNTAEFVAQHFTKGSMIIVQGRLQMRKYNDRDGNSRTAAEIQADNVWFGESKRSMNPDERPPMPDDRDVPPEREPMPTERDLYNDLGGYNNVRFADSDAPLPWE